MLTEQLLAAINMLAGTRRGSRQPAKAASRKAVGSHVLDHPQLGRVTLAVSRRAKRITLTVRPDCTVRLSIPYGIPVENGLKFLESKKDWTLKTLAKYRSRKQDIMPPFNTRSHELVLVNTPEEKIRLKISTAAVTVSFPSTIRPDSEEVQQVIKKGLCEAMRAEAKEILPGRLDAISRETGLRYRKMAVRNTVSKWGSCSARNDISLSLHLMRLPDYLIDYILLHELCHTVHKNHGPQFHGLLDKLTGGRHAALRKELKNYHTRW